MAIQNRRGNIADFDANKMLPGEFAYALDTSELFYCVAPGTVKRCATKEELEQILAATPEAYSALQELIADLENETVLSGILADISNLKTTKLAITGDSKTNTTTFAEASTLANINSAETHATLFGKIKKFFSFVGTTALNTAAQTISAATNEISTAARSGWSTLLTTDKLTYKSASAPIYVCNTLNISNVAKDLRSYLSVGMKIKLTQDATVKYFFITAIDATSVTLYGGSNYTLTNTAITNVYYSVVQSPHGFPIVSNGFGTNFIMEEGSNSFGNYEKWSNGKLVMWGTVNVQTPQTLTAAGTVFCAPTTFNLPITSVTPVSVNVNAPNNFGAWVELSTGTIFLSSVGICLYRVVSGGFSAEVKYEAKGTWK